VDLSFFESQIYAIFDNKQKFYLIDHEFNIDSNPISKCKKIEELVGEWITKTDQKIVLGNFVPRKIYHKFSILSYLLKVKEPTPKIIIKDSQ